MTPANDEHAGHEHGDALGAARLARAAAAALADKTGRDRHNVCVVLGSGWLPALDALATDHCQFDVAELPGFPRPAAVGHPGLVRSFELAGKAVLAFAGRTHLYEGHGVDSVAHSVRVAAAAGCSVIVLTNGAGAIRDDLRVGDAVLIADHLNLTGRTPLVGPRFVDLTNLYTPRLRALMREIDPSLAEGVYAQFHGPQYETPAEVRMAGLLGADLVGMSTAVEAIAARAEGCEVLGISLVTNPAAGVTGRPLDHADVLAAGLAAAGRAGWLVSELITRL